MIIMLVVVVVVMTIMSLVVADDGLNGDDCIVGGRCRGADFVGGSDADCIGGGLFWCC